MTKNDSITKVSAGSSSSSPPISPTTMNAPNISTEKDFLKLVKLAGTSVGRGETYSFHFFSAYFDDRNSVLNTPAVAVLGYSHKGVKDILLYCVFKYSDGCNVCIKKPLVKAHSSFAMVQAKRKRLISVIALSNMSTCNPNFISNEIPVGNRVCCKGKNSHEFLCLCSWPCV